MAKRAAKKKTTEKTLTKRQRVALVRSGARQKSGTLCLVSGQYTLRDGSQATVVIGEPMPPTPRPRMGWKLTDATR